LVNTGATVTFTVVARGTPPLTYQWRFNGGNLPGATSPSVTRANVTLADDGVYEVLINSPAGMTSASATLGVKVVPTILQAPLSQSVVAGSRIAVSVLIAGNPPPFGYQWRSNSFIYPLIVSNSRTNFISLPTATNAVTATFRIVVTNAASTGIVVNAAFTVITLADSDTDGTPDLWSQQYFGHPTGQAGDLSRGGDDFDGDKMSNWGEYFAGTDPTNSLSYLGVSLQAGPASAVVSFGAISNRTYTVQFTDDLGLGLWSRLADVLARTNNRVETFPDPTYTSNRFYRAVTPRVP
jgi:hypothetical protein